jgi:ATP-dependent RNA helicase DDX54/DBP10
MDDEQSASYYEDEEDGQKKAKAGSFQAMGLEKEIMWGLTRMGYKVPTPVQRKALPIALAGMDMVCMARTGSGKTCVFLLPMMQKLKTHDSTSGVRGIVLSPTRELAMQTFKFAKDMAKFTELRVIAIVGGDPIEAQFEALAARPDVIIATPGRLMHHLREISTFKLKHVQYLVFDEADRLFEMGFAEQLNEIVKECPEGRQTLLFSATLPKQLIQFTRAGLRDPQLIRLDTDIKMSDELRLAFFAVRSNEKVAALLYLVRTVIPADQQTIVFTATRHHSEFIHALLKQIGVKSTLVYGSMDQDARSANLNSFRKGHVMYLIVTDLAARGIDVPLLNNVINFHFPQAPKLFVHRCGRAARQGRIGFAFSLVEPDELPYMVDVHLLLNKDVDAAFNAGEGDRTGVSGQTSYTLASMTPDLVQTGLLPQDVLDEENEFFKRSLTDDDNLMMLWRISENGMKQYKRTRSEASRQGVKLAKSLTKANTIRSLHPLIVGEDPKRCNSMVVEKAAFVRMLQTFRPAQTVFESGIGLGTGSQAIKAKAKAGTKEAHGVEVMRAFRKATASALERNKVKLRDSSGALVAGRGGAGEPEEEDDASMAEAPMGDDDDEGMGMRDEFGDIDDSFSDVGSVTVGSAAEKPRLSIAERKKLKRKGVSTGEMRKIAVQKAATDRLVADCDEAAGDNNGRGNKRKRGGGMGVLEELEITGGMGSCFKDSKFFMSYGNDDDKSRFADDLLQPQSGLRDLEIQSASKLESAFLDVTPDTALDLNKKRRILRWDAKKRKFVKQSLEEMSQIKGVKRLRTESGAPIGKSSIPQGEMYAKWKKKSKREVSLPGVLDNDDDRPRPNFKANRGAPEELRDANVIRKMKKESDKNKLKNMPKDKRGKLERQKKKAKSEAGLAKGRLGTKAGSRKMTAILRY